MTRKCAMKLWILIVTTSGILAMVACAAKKSAPAAQSAAQTPAAPAAAADTTMNLAGTEWHLEDLGGAGVIDNSQATLLFPEAGRVAGNSSCNRFMGTVTITGNALKFGPLAGTRMACLSDAVSNQETKYLKALEGASRYEWKEPYLLIYCEGMYKPLRFTRAAAK